MVLQNKLNRLTEQLRPFAILCIGCLYSLLIATNIRCHGSLALFLLEEPSSSIASMPSEGAVNWLGATPGMITFLFVPLFTGVVDHFKLNYRVCAVAASGAILGGSILSTGLLDPGQLIVTDALISGCGASLMLSTIILVIDDYFPAESGLRILATTLVQGVAYATFFLVNAHSALLNCCGWRAGFFAYGGSAAGLGLLSALLFERRPRRHQSGSLESPLLPEAATDDEADVDAANLTVAKRGDGGSSSSSSSIIDAIHNTVEWKSRLLSLSQTEIDSSRTSILWLLERLLASTVSDGAFLVLLTQSGIARHPVVLGSTPSPRLATIMPAFAFSVGSTTSYLGGAVLGCLIHGRLLTVYMSCALVNACALIGWAAVIGGSGSYNAELAFAWACGFGVGGINTFAYAASEEATGTQARSIFPFTKLANGMSIAIIQVANGALASGERKQLDLLLVLLLLLSLAQFGLLILIRQLRSATVYSMTRFRS